MIEREGLTHGCCEGKAEILALRDVPSQIMEECHMSGQVSHALQYLCLVFCSKNCIVLFI